MKKDILFNININNVIIYIQKFFSFFFNILTWIEKAAVLSFRVLLPKEAKKYGNWQSKRILLYNRAGGIKWKISVQRKAFGLISRKNL